MKVHVQRMNLMKNQVIKKIQNLKFWKKGLQGKGFIFKKNLIEKLCSMGSKCLALDVGHMWRK